MIKPLQLQLALSLPELQDNRQFLEAISLQYQSYNLFEEMMEIDLMQKRVEFIQTMKESMVDMDVEGNEIKFFSSEFLVKKYLKMSDADLKLNDKLKQEEIENLHLAGGESSDAAAMAEMAEGNDNAFESNMDKLIDMIIERLEQRVINESKEEKIKKSNKKKIKKTDDKSEIEKEEE
jgi:hypothetical protein